MAPAVAYMFDLEPVQRGDMDATTIGGDSLLSGSGARPTTHHPVPPPLVPKLFAAAPLAGVAAPPPSPSSVAAGRERVASATTAADEENAAHAFPRLTARSQYDTFHVEDQLVLLVKASRDTS